MAKVCPNCKFTTHMYRKVYPDYVQETIFFDHGSNTRYDIDGPIYFGESRQEDEYFCTNCDYQYSGDTIEDIVNEEMVEE